MAQKRLAKVMGAQIKALYRDDHPHVIGIINEADITEWHFLVVGLGGAHKGAEYIFRLKAPNVGNTRFPFHPPSFSFLTPSGVFQPGGKICISIGEFHASDSGGNGAYGWRPALGMRGFAREVVNGLAHSDSLGAGIRIRVLPEKDQKRLAQESRAFNLANHAGLMARFEEAAAEHPGLKAAKAWKAAPSAGGGAEK